jgi:hypothetical protein
MKFEELSGLLAAAVQIGFMEAVKCYEPSKDMVRKNEVLGWLKMMNIDPKRFQALCKTGEIKPFRQGTGVNSPLYYSKKDIKQAFCLVDAINFCRTN